MQYLGDYAEDYATLNFKFSTHKSDGTPIALTDGVVSVYKANGTTQSTAGITLTADFDTVTGLNNVLIDLSADAFYAVGNDYSVVITTGTVNAISVVGTVLAHFSIENRNNKANLVSILGTALTETAGYLAAGFKKFFNVATPTGTVNSLPDAIPGANNGLPTTNGTKINQTVDLTDGQTIAATVAGSVGSISGITFPANFADLAITETTGMVTSEVTDTDISNLKKDIINTIIALGS